MISKVFLSTTFFLATVTSFVAADYNVNTPASGVTWKKGQDVQVKWTVTSNTDKAVDVRLVYGNSNNLQFLRNLCSDLDPTVGVCNYNVASDIKSDINYAIQLGKDPAHYGYSSYFTIISQGDLPENKGCPNMGGNSCTSTLPCCSGSGYCGATADYCGTGCDPKYSFNGKCEVPASEPASDSKKCGNVECTSDTPCCSQYNYCGSTDDHCGSGCQAGKSFAGKCVSTKETSTKETQTSAPTSPTTSVPTSPKTKKCGNSKCNKYSPCCSKYNHCGATAAHCGKGCQPGKSFAGTCIKSKIVKRAPRRNLHRINYDGKLLDDTNVGISVSDNSDNNSSGNN
ncbi:1686_t:CDS:2 [Ambispora gerdemannii]|uniref:1686_t:CDS:1 n=1 Tax=Ambispora gerdemannii TaxID=144530 RepID=A0A9N9BND7_9GLOM|nr:1686_t:CDS:2 [Ambispora gerdemannii]